MRERDARTKGRNPLQEYRGGKDQNCMAMMLRIKNIDL